MIYIQKTGEPEEVSRWKKKFKNKHKREAGYEDIRHEKELQILKNALLAEQRHLCCYCCSYIKNTETEVQKNSFHVEHFRPQAQNQDLSLAYNNLHASCNGDNRRHCGHKKENNFDAFSSTLFVSPYQNHEMMKDVAQKISQAVGIPFFYEDFRPGFAEGTQTSIDLELYRQPYCGCIFSEEERYSNSFKKKRKKKLNITI